MLQQLKTHAEEEDIQLIEQAILNGVSMVQHSLPHETKKYFMERCRLRIGCNHTNNGPKTHIFLSNCVPICVCMT